MDIENPQIIVDILRGNGSAYGDPVASSVWSYEDCYEKESYAVFLNEDQNDIHLSPFISRRNRQPTALFINGVVTEAGKDFINKHSIPSQ